MYLGIDVGSLAAKAVLLDRNERVVGWAIAPSGTDHVRTVEQLVGSVLESAGIAREAIRKTVGTGYGRRNIPFADLAITEISCHARGAALLYPGCRTVVDIGGQDSKVIIIDDRGKVLDFSMNDRCAAGTGRFLEVMAGTLKVPLDEMDLLSQRARRTAKISSVCTVFAESEIVGLIAGGENKEDIVKGLCRSIAERVGTLASRLDPLPPMVMTGGVALNGAVVKALEEKLSHSLFVPENPQIAGALGAALIAHKEDEKGTRP